MNLFLLATLVPSLSIACTVPTKLVNNLSNELSVNNYENEEKYGKSNDYIKYSTKGETLYFSLPELLNVFISLNQVRLENQSKISFSGVPEWIVLDDNKELLGLGNLQFDAWTNINNLLSSSVDKNIEFLDVWTVLHPAENSSFIVNLKYKIDGVQQTMNLFTLLTKDFPTSQNNMEVIFAYTFLEKNFNLK